MKRRYSGEKSAKFWAKIRKVKNREIHDKLYDKGCDLQNLEQKVLEMLKSALTPADGKTP